MKNKSNKEDRFSTDLMRSVALFLSGKLPPYFDDSFHKYQFVKEIQKIDSKEFDNEEIKFCFKLSNNSDEEFYWMLLDSLNKDYGKKEVGNMLFNLNIPKDLVIKYGEDIDGVENKKSSKEQFSKKIINGVSFYLAGKKPPYFHQGNKYSFIKEIQKINNREFTVDQINFCNSLLGNNEEEFYGTILNYINKEYGKNKVLKILSNLEVPEKIFEEYGEYSVYSDNNEYYENVSFVKILKH